MKIVFVLSVISLMVALLSSCAPRVSPITPLTEKPAGVAPPAAKESQETEWEKTVSQAKKERKVVVYCTANVSDAFIPFQEKYRITVEVITGRGAEISTKLISERRAGLYLADVYQGGVTTLFNVIKPAGILEPMSELFVLPEVTDNTKWLSGGIPFSDKQKKVISFIVGIGPKYVANSKLVKSGELKSIQDFLDPKLKGKIILNDPTTAGAGLLWFGFTVREILGLEKGREYMRSLAKQEPMISRDQRLQMDWLAQGKYAILLAPQRELVAEFQSIGAPIMPVEMEEISPISPGSGSVALINKAPHPDASRVFINWLLSREGQTSYVKAFGFPSARLDVSTQGIDKLYIPDPRKKYAVLTEDFYMGQNDMRELAVEIFSPLSK